MQVAFYFALAVFFLIMAGLCLAILLTVIRIGSDRWREASSLSGPLSKVLTGEVEGDRDGLRDPRVAKGKVWKKATSKWGAQGKLSDEYIKNMAG